MEQLVQGVAIKKQLLALIKKDHPDFKEDNYISHAVLNDYRKQYQQLIKKEKKEINHLEKEVIKAIQENTLLSENIEPEMESDLSLGEKTADKIAEFGGSWTFIIVFFSFLLVWMAINIWVLATEPFDPYPFILLNLILSCIATIQAPILTSTKKATTITPRAYPHEVLPIPISNVPYTLEQTWAGHIQTGATPHP